MRRRTLSWQLVSALAIATPAVAPLAQDAQAASIAASQWTTDELDNLLAPIALYPDPILAQVLVAATYPDQVLAAQAHVKAFGTDNIDQMPWEISVKAVARYEPVLNMLADGEDWMTALGQAYATQPADVTDAVQRLRRMANEQGNLQTTAQQQVVVEREVIRIVPAEPRVIYVPTYDPAVIYHRPVYVTHAHPAYWSWGVGYPVGVWLTYDVDWWGHRVYHHGWHSHGPRWVVVARPWIAVSPIYVAPRHTIVVVNRGVVNRRWDTRYVRRYGVVHRNAGFERHDRGFRRDGDGRVAERRAVPRNDAYGKRVAPSATRDLGRVARTGDTRGETRSVTPRTNERGGTARQERAVPAPEMPRATRVPSVTRAPRENAPRMSAPRERAPQASAPRAESAPRASAPRRESTPRATAPRSESAPRASAPRSGGNSAPRASAPRSTGSSTPRGGDRGGNRSSTREKPRGN